MRVGAFSMAGADGCIDRLRISFDTDRVASLLAGSEDSQDSDAVNGWRRRDRSQKCDDIGDFAIGEHFFRIGRHPARGGANKTGDRFRRRGIGRQCAPGPAALSVGAVAQMASDSHEGLLTAPWGRRHFLGHCDQTAEQAENQEGARHDFRIHRE